MTDPINNKSIKAPLGIFKKTVRYFPTFSVNIILINKNKEFLLVKRKMNPARGMYYLPGSRVLNGETVKVCGQRVLKEELGIKGKMKYISTEYTEEIWPTKNFKGDFGSYDKNTRYVHYLSTTIVAELARGDEIKLDNEAENHTWFKKVPEKPPFLALCFGTAKNFLKKHYSIKV